MENKKNLYKQLVIVGLPITLQCLMQSLLPIVDELMVGQLSENAIASITVGNRIYSIFYFIIMALVGATSIYVTQLWGSKKKESIEKAFKIPFLVGLFTLFIYLFVAFFLPTQSVSLFASESDIIRTSAMVQKIYALSAVPVFFSCMFQTVLRSTKHVKAPMVCGIVSVIMNTILNAVFIFGFAFIPAMGFVGAAIATLLARIIEALLLAGFVYISNRHEFKFNIFRILTLKVDAQFKKAYCHTMFPLLLMNVMFAVADTVYSVIYGQMGADAIAAISIMFPIQGFSIGLFNGMASASAIILGNELGEKHIDTAISFSKSIVRVTTVLSIAISAVLAGFSQVYVSMYNVSEQVQFYSLMLVLVSAFYLTFKVLNMVISQGIIQCGGETKFVLLLDIIGPWCVGIPLALLGTFVLDLPVYIVFAMLTMEELVRIVLGFYKYRKFEWATNIVSDIKV
ncbi:MAG: MATE family efflux transporter [Ruminococcus sp.]|nr:MATE family efflux transporter [Ruminococcus sp.]